MTLLSAGAVDWDAVLDVVWLSAAAGIGVTVAFALAIVSAAGMVDFGRERRVIGAVASGLVLLVTLAACAGAIVFGVVAMTSK